MSLLKKSVFLTSGQKLGSMGLLTIEKKNNNMFGTLKLYSGNFNGEYVLGLKFDDKVIKQNVNIQNNNYSFILPNNTQLDGNIGCVLVKNDINGIEPLLWGSEKSKEYKGKILSSLRESITKINNNLNTTPTKKTEYEASKEVIDELLNEKLKSELNDLKEENSQKNIDAPPQDDIEKISDNDKSENTTEPKVEETFDTTLDETEKAYAPITNHGMKIEAQSKLSDTAESEAEIAVAMEQSSVLFESNENEINKDIDKNIFSSPAGNHKFYDMIADQLQELFERYPKEENLCKLIDNSNWVKIDGDSVNKHYVVGIIMQDYDIKYICYGVPGQYMSEPPQELIGYSQWLPTDTKNPYTNGYWVMYQDADTGENIYIN